MTVVDPRAESAALDQRAEELAKAGDPDQANTEREKFLLGVIRDIDTWDRWFLDEYTEDALPRLVADFGFERDV